MCMMRLRTLAVAACSTLLIPVRAQDIYFPPAVPGSAWETLDPTTLGWCPERIDSLYDFLEAKNTKAFLVLKSGRIVLEHYFGTFNQDSLWYWASAGKTLKSTLTGMAQEDGFLDIEAPTSNYLGTGWTSATSAQEQLIHVRHQLSMTTGLDDGVPDSDCTDPACLVYLADAGTRWAYHNAPYTLLSDVIANATGQPFSIYFNQRLRDPIGMDGFWFQLGELQLYYSTARSMARFGLLALNHMVWDGDTLLHDTAFFHAATTPSQDLNPAYGYLWWLNGQNGFMLPQSQIVFTGSLMPDAPADMFCGLGKNNQLLNVVPSEDLVLVRVGNDPDPDPNTPSVSIILDNEIWQYMNVLDCGTGIGENEATGGLALAPNPCTDRLRMNLPGGAAGWTVTVRDAMGRPMTLAESNGTMNTSALASGAYGVTAIHGQRVLTGRFIKQR
jgi:CubicO group peptidase (beta-lactamase class C family)